MRETADVEEKNYRQDFLTTARASEKFIHSFPDERADYSTRSL
jgi:hypothetical protein